MKHEYQELADALWQARELREPILPPRQWLEGADVHGAYTVQRFNNTRRLQQGRRLIGRKIGLTSQAVQKQLGVDQPDFGLLFDDMLYEGDAGLPFARMLQPKIEGEIAFILERDITKRNPSRDELKLAAGYAAPAFEIVDSAIKDWKITLADTIADNASCGALVVSHERKAVSKLDLRLAGMILSEDEQPVSLGVGAACLGDPLAALQWLATIAIEQDEPLRRGEIVLTGALGPMVTFLRGKRYKLEIAGFNPLHAHAE